MAEGVLRQRSDVVAATTGRYRGLIPRAPLAPTPPPRPWLARPWLDLSRLFRHWLAPLVAAVFLLSTHAPAQAAGAGDAAGTVCAVVEIEIEQELTLERQAFDAHLRVVNGLESVALEDVTVEVDFADAAGNEVVATSDPDDEDAAFFIRVDELDNIDTVEGGTIAGGAEANMHWLIVPAPGSADADPNGTLYMVGAELSYTYGGETEQIEVTPDSIRVKPMPALTLDYFLPRDVHADDPLTEAMEAPIPFTLGVRVTNSGDGEARSLAIESAQPEIVSNELGVPIDFRIIDSQVDGAAREPNLNLDFGTIEQGEARIGRWRMETTLSGRFVEFDARYTHADEFGGALTSLLEGVRTHELIGDVRVDLPGRDDVRDFLAVDADADSPRVYESNGEDSGVDDHSDVAELTELGNDGDSAVVEIELPPSAGFAYARLEDPYDRAFGVERVIREDGKRLPASNAWIETEYLSGGGRASWLHLFDVDTPGGYTVELSARSIAAGDPVIGFIPDKTTHEGGQLGFLVEAGDAAGNEPALALEGPGRGETFDDHGDGSATFHWTPQAGDAGEYTLRFRAEHDGRSSTRSVQVRVHPAHDTDGDGMDDAWELEHFGHLDRDGSGDYSGDGISDRMAFERGLDPTQEYTVDRFRAALASAIIDDAPRRIDYPRSFQAPVVITGPASFNDPDPGTVAVETGAEEFELRFAEWPHLAGEHAAESVSYLLAEPGSYFVDLDDHDIMIEVGTFELERAGEWSEHRFNGEFPGAPTVLSTIQRRGDSTRVLAPRIEQVGPEGFSAGVFAADAGAGARDIDVSVGYLAIHDADGEGVLPLLDRDLDYQRFRQSLSGSAAEIGGEALRLQADGADGSSDYSQAEPVGGLALSGHLFAASQDAGRAAPVTLRAGPAGGETPRFNFARPSRVHATADGEVTVEIVRSGPLEEEGRVDLATANRTAIAGRDYQGREETLVFSPGESLQRVTIDLLADGNDQPSQAFDVVLSAHDSTSTIAAPEQVLVTVVDGPVEDSNHSGMADVWEQHYFGGLDVEPGSGDYDSDGRNNRRAFLEGFDPTAGQARPEWLEWQPRAVIDSDWQDLGLDAGADAIVLAGSVSDYDPSPGLARLRHHDGAWQGRFARYDASEHGLEALAVLAIAPGEHALGLDTWQAGRAELAGDGEWQRIDFAEPHEHAPHLLSSPQGAPGGVAARIRELDASGFEARLAGPGVPTAEPVELGWLAIGGDIARGRLELDDATHSYRIARAALDAEPAEQGPARLSLQDPGASDSLAVELIDRLHIGASTFAQSVTPANAGALAIRRHVPRDADHDGLADRWELAHGLDPDERDDAHIDLDGDGTSALAEYVAGSDPRDPDSTPIAAEPRLQTPLISAWPTPIELGHRYTDPIVLSGAASDYDPDPGVVRLNFLETERVHAWFQEWAYLGGLHGRERVPLLSLEAGRHLIDDRQVWEAGRIDVDGAGEWREVAFEQAHDEAPRVLVTPQSGHSATAIVARVRNVSASGFEVAVFAEQGADADAVEAETLGYLAASAIDRHDRATTGYLDTPGESRRFRLERTELDHHEREIGRTRLRLQSEQSQDPDPAREAETVDVLRFDTGLFAQDISYHDARPASIREVSAAGDGIALSEAFRIRHGLDPDDPGIGAIDVSGDGFSILEEYVAGTDIFDPGDSPARPGIRGHSASAGATWTPVSLARHYRDPVILAGAASSHDPTPGVVQLDAVEHQSLQLRLAPWAYIDEVRTEAEDIPLLAIDAGRHLVGDDQIWEAATVDSADAGDWREVRFDQAHDAVPRILVTPQSTRNDAPVVARVRNVTESGFEVAVFGEQAGDPADYRGETLGWLAVSGAGEGELSWDGQPRALRLEQISLDHQGHSPEGHAEALYLQEEQSLTEATEHADELVDLLLLDERLFAQDVSFREADPVVVRRKPAEDGE